MDGGWRSRTRIPTEIDIQRSNKRMADREREIRRPGRKINVISNEEWAEMQAAREKVARKEKELQILWQSKHLDAIRQRNNLIRYKLFLLLKDIFNIDTSNADTVSKQPLARAIAAVCNSITKDSVSYTYVNVLSEDGDVPWYAEPLHQYIRGSLGIPIDRDDIWSVRKAVKEKKPLLELIRSQVERDLEEVTAALKLRQGLSSIPKYSDPEVAENVHSNVFRCIDNIDDSMLRADDMPSENDAMGSVVFRINSTDGSMVQVDNIPRKKYATEEQYVADLHKAIDEATIYHGLAGVMKGYPTRLRLDTEQLKALKGALNTKASIRAFYDSCRDTEWSEIVEGLSEEKKVLESLVGPDSDAILRTINGAIADTYLTNNRLVEESAKIRNEVYSSGGRRLGMMGAGARPAPNTEKYEKACQEESTKFRDMENDTAYKKLFPPRYSLGGEDFSLVENNSTLEENDSTSEENGSRLEENGSRLGRNRFADLDMIIMSGFI